MRTIRLTALLAVLCAAAPVQAQGRLLATAGLDGTYQDLAPRTAAPLENGVAGNLLGGLGSGLAYAGGNTFLVLPDRGPNAVSYDGALDDTASYIDRFHSLYLALAPNAPGAALPFTLTAFATGTTLLSSRLPLAYGTGAGLGVGSGEPALNAEDRTHYFTGRSDGFDPAHPSNWIWNARLDPESLRVSRDGRSVFISDEYGPALYEFDRATGRRLRAIPLPAHLAAAHPAPTGDAEIAGNASGRLANKGMEGLAITPDGRTLVGAMQSPLIQDGGKDGGFTRLVAVDLRSGAIREFAYPLTNLGSAAKPKYTTVSDIVAINGHEFLVDERDGKGLGDGSVAAFKRLYRVDLSGAPQVGGVEGAEAMAARAVPKTQVVDLVEVLQAAGIPATEIPAKIEGLAFGPDQVLDGAAVHTLFVSCDNDFLGTVTDTYHPQGAPNPSRIFVIGLTDAELPGFEPQELETGEDCGRR